MRLIFLVWFWLIPVSSFAQTTFYYKYKEVCSGETRTVKATIENREDTFTIFFFGEYRTFTYLDFVNGAYEQWMVTVYRQWTQYYPCAELSALVQETSKKVAEQNETEITQPLIIVSSDLGYYSGGVIRTGVGYSETNRLTGVGSGGVGSLDTETVSSFGIFRINPISKTTNAVENLNLIITTDYVLGNLLHGFHYKHRLGSAFLFNTITFGFLNGFGFQDNSLVFGGGGKIYSNNHININLITIVSYTYHVRIFKISYWFEDHLKLNPNLSLTYKLSPSFGLGLTGTINYRTDQRRPTNAGLLAGGKLFF